MSESRRQIDSFLETLSEKQLQVVLQALQAGHSQTQINTDQANGLRVSVQGGTAYIANTLNLNQPTIEIDVAVLEVALTRLLQQRSSVTGIPQNLPYSGAIKFVGRDEELKSLHQQLQQETTVVISEITGMGGIGKTELALQYARKHGREGSYPGGLCWLRAREEVGTQIISFVRSCSNLTPPEDLELVEKVRWCWGRWREEAALLIFDDVQQYEDVASFLPPQESRFKVLMTSRLHFGSPVQELQLDVLSQEKALELLRAFVQDERVDQEIERSKELCKWLGYLPLGLELVGRYLAKKQDLLIELLWQRLQDKRLEARAFKQAEPGMTASLGVTAAFELSWQELEESAQQVAAVLSLFALVEIPWVLVEQCLPEVDAEELEEIRDQALLGANLLKRVDQGMYQLHQLLKEFFASKREQRSDVEELQRKFYEVVIAEAERVRNKPEQSLTRESTITIAHLLETFELLARLEQGIDLATCLHWMAELYRAQGQYAEAEPLYRRSLSIREQYLGQEHLQVSTSLDSLAMLYRWQGRYTEAEPLFIRSLSIREQCLGQDHCEVALSLNNLANLYFSQGHYEEAEPFYLRSLDIYQRLLGDDHRYVGASLNNLANLYTSQGRYGEAEPLHLNALNLLQQKLGNNNPHVAMSQGNLARLYRFQARYDDAESLLLQSLSILQDQLPTEHPMIARALSDLAYVYDLQGRYSEAEFFYLQSLPIFFAKVAKSHYQRQEASNNFRSLLQKALQENRTDELSDDPMTRSLLQEL